MTFPRESGILLHPTSLPGPYGIGEIGLEAFKFADALEDMGQHLWQILPIGPTGYGDSPYQSFSTFAGNHLLISFDLLIKDRLLTRRRLARFPRFPDGPVDFGPVIQERMKVLRHVCRNFGQRASRRRQKALRNFCAANAYWLDDYALFMALKDAHEGRPWPTWEEELVVRDPKALQRARRKYQRAMRDVQIMQFLFDEQWKRLLDYCHGKGIRVIGDIPIFVAHDSADVWAHPELFFVNGHGHLIVQAGVPPDYFSETGQLWGNPLYRWNVHRNSNFAWWVARMRRIFELVDIVRIDHFRGFEKYWEVPAHEKTAINGRWVEGPEGSLFEELIKQLGPLPIIAEDLGVITPEVEALRDKFHFPGMRILQFAFGADPKAEDYRPESYPANCVVYTGTHDTNTTVGWFHEKAGKGSTRTAEQIEIEHRHVLRYLKTDGHEIHWDMIGLALRSSANTAVVPLQDLMGLGVEARMNRPGHPRGNWQWRFTRDMLTPEIKARLVALTHESRRGV
ncbi:MAG: 4-alpha-glucanotransferase [Kiritimatiellae bacterium]|nr:4-alpha-glucanotransferase [Kiritimatiellia bacterium]